MLERLETTIKAMEDEYPNVFTGLWDFYKRMAEQSETKVFENADINEKVENYVLDFHPRHIYPADFYIRNHKLYVITTLRAT